MFISIMSGVINEVTRQPAAATAPRGQSHARASRALATARRAKRVSRGPQGRGNALLPDQYRVLAATFRRAAGFLG